MNSKKARVLDAIYHKHPDKLPKGELEIDKKLRAALLKDKITDDDFTNEVNVRNLLTMDIAPVICLDRPEDKIITVDADDRQIQQDVFGGRYLSNANDSMMISPAIHNIEAAKDYEFPPIEVFTNDTLNLWTKTDFFTFGVVDGTFNCVYPFFGLTEFLMYTATHPKEIENFIDRAVDYWIKMAKVLIQAKPDAILIGDDMASSKSTMMSPAKLRELIFPAMKREIETLKEMTSLPVFLHCDGNINAILDDIIDMGFDGLHSLQPSAGMDIEHIKKCYGDRLCLMGNLDLDELLPFGTRKEVEKQVKWLIDTAGKDGGYILSTCNMLSDIVIPENALAMYEAAEKYGYY